VDGRRHGAVVHRHAVLDGTQSLLTSAGSNFKRNPITMKTKSFLELADIKATASVATPANKIPLSITLRSPWESSRTNYTACVTVRAIL